MGKKDDEQDNPQSERPSDGDFQQQNLRAWQPLLTPKWVIATFIAVGILFIPIGVVVLVTSGNVVEYSKKYEDKSDTSDKTEITFNIKQKMEPPIYMYYKLTNFYQSHRRYVKSRSDPQLRGDLEGQSFDSCEPLKYGSDEKIAYPCGLIANSFFNDTFELFYNDVRFTDSDYDGAGSGKIAWQSDRREKFKVVDDLDLQKFTKNSSDNRRLPGVDDEDFIVWMRTAGLPTFKKLKYVINKALNNGDKLTIQIGSNFPVEKFQGTKSVVLSTSSWLGGKNDFLGYAYVVVGALCMVLAGIFSLKQKFSPRSLGDMKYFNLKNAQH